MKIVFHSNIKPEDNDALLEKLYQDSVSISPDKK